VAVTVDLVRCLGVQLCACGCYALAVFSMIVCISPCYATGSRAQQQSVAVIVDLVRCLSELSGSKWLVGLLMLHIWPQHCAGSFDVVSRDVVRLALFGEYIHAASAESGIPSLL
jgi:hypothetical protein